MGYQKNNMLALWQSSQLGGANMPYLEQLYEDFLADSTAVPEQWREFFSDLPKVNGHLSDVPHSIVREQFRRFQPLSAPLTHRQPVPQDLDHERNQVRVLQLINSYRFLAHQVANVDPLYLTELDDVPDLTLDFHSLSGDNLDTIFDTGSLVTKQQQSLREILDVLEKTYCNSVGAEYMHITNTVEKRWIQNCLEGCNSTPEFNKETKLQLLERLIAAEGLEKYLHTKYVGQKRFSLEGAESLIPCLNELIQRSGEALAKEVIIGMAHRGRLNVLINIMGKTASEIFLEFEGKFKRKEAQTGTGDVKYHLGFSSNIRTAGGMVHVALAFNPSHLEIVSPVVEGSTRARQDRHNDDLGDSVIPVIIHGDAAFAGQGVVMETFNMSQSRGFSTKGTVHIVINNQIGFTTSNQKDARSTRYCTDVAKMVGAPIFHVNGDDPEAVVFVTRIALDYRMKFKKDVVIDMVCYRRHGHSEADEPRVTQPMMYKNITDKSSVRQLYFERLKLEGLVSESTDTEMTENYRVKLESDESIVPNLIEEQDVCYSYEASWKPYMNGEICYDVDTRISNQRIHKIVERLQVLPEGFALHKNVARIYKNRNKMAAGALGIDWGLGETLAYASMLEERYSVRLSGQDCGRGTFFHRHAVVYNQNDGESEIPLRRFAESGNSFLVINSLLSEEAVLAFEYGYSTTDPRTLTIWEAQFGDFANNAQVVIDQFISAGEQKWNRLSGLTLLLPHGFEGQGPEHSSARLERYLQLCAQRNMQVCMPTTPAQIFHLLRRQILGKYRKPLVVMSPKSLLRLPAAVSSLEEFSAGHFQTVIAEIDKIDAGKVKRVVLCSGKVFYDLIDKRRKDKKTQVAIIRLEQIYPFPEILLGKILKKYKNATEFIWCQEEPKNQGVWFSSLHHMNAVLAEGVQWQYAGRPLSAAPAVGHASLHIKQQNELVAEAIS